MSDCVWVVEVGGGLRSAHTDLASAGIAFDNAYRPDVSRHLTCVRLDPAHPEYANQPSEFEQQYAIKFRDGRIADVSLWNDFDLSESARYISGYGWVVLKAMGAHAAIEAAIAIWDELPELPDV